MKHNEKWYQTRLAKYFDEYFSEYEDDVEWFNDPDINNWLFDIPSLGIKVDLTCNDKGKVSELRYRIL